MLAVAGRIIGIAFLVFGLALTILRSGWRMLVTVVAAAALGAVLVVLLDGIVDVADGDLVTKLSTGLGPATDPRFPSVVGIGMARPPS